MSGPSPKKPVKPPLASGQPPLKPAAVPAKPVVPGAPAPAKPVAPAPASPRPAAPKAATPKAVPPKAPPTQRAPARSQPSSAARPAPGNDPGETAGVPGAAARPAAAAAAPADPLVGTTLGRCRIEARIGQGRTATVYRAHHTALEATVAIKVLLPQARAVPEIVEKFATEARAIARIDNENVLKIYDVGQEGEQHFLVMELLDGDSILDVLQRESRFEPLDALRVTRQAANGLAAAHAVGIIHRDVKPQNLVLLQDGTVKLVDFGLAAGDETGSQRVGTPHYMAPEVCESGQAVPQTDVYALGISLFHMLTGQPPYAGKAVKEILASHVKGEPLHPERKVTNLPREIAELVRRLTKRNAAERPTAAEAVTELDRIGGQDLRKKDALRARSARYRSRREARRKASPVPLIAGGVVVLGGLGALLAFAGGSSGGETPPAPVSAPRPGPAPVAAPPPETAAERAAREKREEAERSKKRELEAAQALKGVEGWIRENWRGPSDTDAVLARYRNFRTEWKGTEAAKAAEERLKQIPAGKLHPHPDRSWSDAEAVEATRTQWSEVLPQVEALLGQGDFAGAKGRVPTAVEDAGGQPAVELRFWADVTQHAEELQQGLAGAVEALPERDRALPLARGAARVKRVLGPAGFEVEIERKTAVVPWAEVPPAEVFRLAQAAFTGKPARLHLTLMAFAWIHGLSDEFWAADLELGTGDGARTYAREIAAYKRGFEARAAQKAAEREGRKGSGGPGK